MSKYDLLINVGFDFHCCWLMSTNYTHVFFDSFHFKVLLCFVLFFLSAFIRCELYRFKLHCHQCFFAFFLQCLHTHTHTRLLTHSWRSQRVAKGQRTAYTNVWPDNTCFWAALFSSFAELFICHCSPGDAFRQCNYPLYTYRETTTVVTEESISPLPNRIKTRIF